MDLLKYLIQEGIFDFFKQKKKQQNSEIKEFIKNRMLHYRLHGSEHPDKSEIMKFFQSVIDEVQEKFGKICVPSLDREGIEDLAYEYLQKSGLLK